MLYKLFETRHLLYLLLSLHSLLSSQVSVVAQTSSKGRKNVQMIEDIQRTVTQIWTNLEKNSAKYTIDWQQKLVGFESNIYVLTTRIEKIIDWIDTNKLNNKVFDDRLDRLESKIISIESIISDKLSSLINKSEQIVLSISNSDTSTDGKLRKLMNIITDAYQLSKEMSIAFKGRQGGSSLYGTGDGAGDGQDGHNRIDEMQKKLLEQLSVVEAGVSNQVSNIAKMSKESLQSLHDIIIEMLNLRDECHTQRIQQSKCNCDQQTGNEYNNHSTTATNARSDRHHSLSSDSPQCPSINMSNIQNDIGSLQYKIGNKIETEITKISKKIDELSKNRTDVIKVVQSESTINEFTKQNPIFPLSQSSFKFAKRIINPIDRPTGRSACHHSSELLAPKNCKELRDSGADCDGVYIVMLSNTKVVRVYCDMTDNGGGWTVILRRGDFGTNSKHKISFNQDWNGYKGGFGDVEKGEFWIGLENIHKLTSDGEHILQVDLESFDDDYISIVFDGFRVADESENYKLYVGNPLNSNTTVAESLISHNVSMFTTRDRNNGINEDNCATKLGGGWWFHNCHSAFLTAPYFRSNDRRHLWQGMQWHSWKQWHHLKAAQMKIRSKS